MNKPKLPLVLVAGSLTLPSVVLAQAQPVPAQPAAATNALEKARLDLQKNTDKGLDLLSSGSPNDRAMAGFQKPNITFNTDQDDTKVSAAFSFNLETSMPKELPPSADGQRWVSVSMTKLLLSASVPIASDNKSISSLFLGDSFIDGAKIKLTLSRFSNTLGVPSASRAREIAGPAYKACIVDQAQVWIDDGGVSLITPANKALALEQLAGSKFGGSLQGAIRNLGASPAGSLDKFIFDQCLSGNGRFSSEQSIVETYTNDGSRYSAMFYGKRSWIKFYGVDASLGQDKYTYLDRTQFATVDKSKTSWEVGAYYGMISWNSTFSWRLRGVYGRSYELPDEVEICHPGEETVPEHCVKGPDGPPKRKNAGLVSLETRHLLAINKDTKIAFAPQVTYRFEDDVVGVEVPVYLSPDDQGKLTGGLKFAYTSDKDEFGVGVFIGIPFSTLFE